jgi:PST family polysaccharide transporter
VTTPPSEYTATQARAFAGVRWLVLRHGLIVVMSLAGSTYLIRTLGPERWGGFSMSYFLLVAADGLLSRNLVAGLLRREIPDDPDVVAGMARVATYAGLALATLLAVFPLLSRPWFEPPGFSLLLLASAVCMVGYTLRAIPLVLLERELRYRPVAVAEVADMVAFYALAVPVALAGHGIEGLALGTVGRAVVSIAVLRTARRAPLVGRSARRARDLLPFGLSLSAQQAVAIADGLVPIFLIGRHQAQLGFLLVATTMMGYCIAVAAAAQRVAIPSLARLTGDDLRKAVERSAAVSSCFTVAVVLPLGTLAPVWVEPLLGPAYADAVAPVVLIALANMVAGPTTVATSALTAIGKGHHVMITQIAVTACYVTSAAVLVSLIGPVGCAWGVVISRLLWLAVSWTLARTHLGVGFPRDLWLPLGIASTVFGMVLVVAERSGIWGFVATALGMVVWLASARRPLGSTLRAVRLRPMPKIL